MESMQQAADEAQDLREGRQAAEAAQQQLQAELDAREQALEAAKQVTFCCLDPFCDVGSCPDLEAQQP